MMDADIAQASNTEPVAENPSTSMSNAPEEPVDSPVAEEKGPTAGSPIGSEHGQGVEPVHTSSDGLPETTAQKNTGPGESTRPTTQRQNTAGGATKAGAEGLNMPKGAEDKQPCGCKKGGRNLVVCIDGTSNQFGIQNSNVVEFYSLIKKGDGPNQRTWYNSGIGTYAKPSWKSLSYLLRTISHKIDMAIAWNFERIVCGAYRWLSDNYEPGDCIYLLGFSRGAYQVRVISAMIKKVGLIHKGNEMQIPFAYELYCRESDPALCNNFKSTFSREDVKVHFVGAWDTVSSVGVIRARKLLPNTVDGMRHVCYFRHALALDERRVKFLPEYANGGLVKPKASDAQESPTPPPSPNHSIPQPSIQPVQLPPTQPNQLPPIEPTGLPSSIEALPTQESPIQHRWRPTREWLQILLKKLWKPQMPPAKEPPIHLPRRHKTAGNSEWPGDVKEVWFAGTHSDIGGGNVENMDMLRKVPPLRWMVSEAKTAGLRMNRLRNEFVSLETVDIIESLTGLWWLLEVLPVKRLAYTDQFSTTRRPHLGHGRTICNGQKIDLSVCLTKENWVPKARPLASTADTDTHFDPKVRNEIDGFLSGATDEYPPFLEVNQYERARIMLLRYIKGTEASDVSLKNKLRSSDSQWQDNLLSVLINLLSEPRSSERLGSEILDAFNQELSPLKIRRRQTDLTVASPLIKELLGGDKEAQETARQFLHGFTLPIIHTTEFVYCTVFSKDGKYIFHDCCTQYIRVSDARTGEVAAEMPALGDVCAIALSSSGRRCVVGGSCRSDNSGFLQVFEWREEQRHLDEVKAQRFEHRLYRQSVGFLPNQDPKQEEEVLVLQDREIWVWNVSTGNLNQMEGNISQVSRIAFSPRGDTIAAFSPRPREFRVWNAATKEFSLLTRVDDRITYMACSTDGALLVSGSLDGPILIWDTDKEGGGHLSGHTAWVRFVCFSPDSKLLVSGSDDGTVRVWNVTTSKLLETFVGHEARVRSVAFSPDGKQIVSGSDDNTIRVWDIENISDSYSAPPAPDEVLESE